MKAVYSPAGCLHRLLMLIAHRRSSLRCGERHNLVLVFLQTWNQHLGLPRIRPGNGFAAVAESFLRETFRKTAGLGSFGPRVTVAVERNTGDFDQLATADKRFGAIGLFPADDLRKEVTCHGSPLKNFHY